MFGLCLVYVWVMNHFRVVLGEIHDRFLMWDGIEEVYERKVSERGKICHFWAVSATGTGTKQGWYRHHLCRGKMVPVPSKVVLVPLTRTGLVPVLVPLPPATLISCIWTLLSPNSYTDSIGTLVND